jgi:hypothetical protein
MIPFVYPRAAPLRRHGPAGYAQYERYRPWLRDEFAFRCVYCLKREQWGVVRATYHRVCLHSVGRESIGYPDELPGFIPFHQEEPHGP